jgi:hypothetical protein
MIAHRGGLTLMVDPAGPPDRLSHAAGRPTTSLFTGGDMTAEAPSRVPRSVVDEDTDGGNATGAFSSHSTGNGHANGSAPDGADPSADVHEPAAADVHEPAAADVHEPAAADAIEAHVAEPDQADPAPSADGARAAAEQVTDQPAAVPQADAPGIDATGSAALDPGTDAGIDATGSAALDPGADPGTDPGIDAAQVEAAGTLAGPDETGDDLGEPVDAGTTDPAEGIDDGPAPLPAEDVAIDVAEQLGAVVGEDVEADPAEFAAAAVLDVLRAAGWADSTEAAELKAEATRLRELLAEVIRDHRAREASAAGGQNQQLYWLVPLLRAAHGVAFGSLGAKVALRTAVQEVPPDVLALAGLRIDYGVEPAYDDQ